MATPKGEGLPTATGIGIRTGNGTEKESGTVGLDGKGNAKAWIWKSSENSSASQEARFDRESDAKESDRVGNARPKGKSPEESLDRM
ncbi:hypothetical protein, partial [Streptomyces sp. NPDC052042]|uniref:hypothetical protein n=1 Tax=Streptomyces sp. NPDC052042 TaxID=3365683 RepID=UPI0037D27F8A